MKISIFGLGYVGAVSAGCLAARGHKIVGVDPAGEKVRLINAGKSPVIERGLEQLIASAVKDGRITATHDATEAVVATDLSLICVGTPSRPNGSLDVSHIQTVAREIGRAIATKRNSHIVVIRSTVLPGTVREILVPELE